MCTSTVFVNDTKNIFTFKSSSDSGLIQVNFISSIVPAWKSLCKNFFFQINWPLLYARHHGNHFIGNISFNLHTAFETYLKRGKLSFRKL